MQICTIIWGDDTFLDMVPDIMIKMDPMIDFRFSYWLSVILLSSLHDHV
jgi:hypothetical protein